MIWALLGGPQACGWTDSAAPNNTTVDNFINGGVDASSLPIVPLSLSATDDVGVTGYFVIDNGTGIEPTAPDAEDVGWIGIAPTLNFNTTIDYTFTGTYIAGDTIYVYLWFKDNKGNISRVMSGKTPPDLSCTTTIPGGLVAGETWTIAGSPYCVMGDIQVSLLTIEPGVEVLVDGPYKIDVLSTITAIGTATAPILFSSKDPAEPTNQRWKGIKFQNTPAGSTFTHCIIEYSDDSGITLVNSIPVISNCIIRNNSAVSSGGGINANIASGDLLIDSTEITNNSSEIYGGGLYAVMSDGLLGIDTSTISTNRAGPSTGVGNGYGGGIYINGNSTIGLSTISGNTTYSLHTGAHSYSRGAGIYSVSGNLVVGNTVIADNIAQARFSWSGVNLGAAALGGGIYMNDGGLTATNAIIGCNTSTAGGGTAFNMSQGSGVYVNAGTTTIENTTVARNNVEGLRAVSGDVTVLNSILYFNNSDGVQIVGTVTATYSDVQGGFTGLGNIDFNPVFAGLGCSINDIKVVVGSSAIDAGNPDPVYDDVCIPPSEGTTANDMGAFGGPQACGW